MAKAGTLYVAAVLILVCGLWAVFACGARLQAPGFLGGVWQPVSGSSPSTAVPFTIIQSGRFLKVQAGSGSAFDLQWESEVEDDNGSRRTELTGRGQSLIVRRKPATRPGDPGEYEFQFKGTINGAWFAVREAGDDQAVIPAAH